MNTYSFIKTDDTDKVHIYTKGSQELTALCGTYNPHFAKKTIFAKTANVKQARVIAVNLANDDENEIRICDRCVGALYSIKH